MKVQELITKLQEEDPMKDVAVRIHQHTVDKWVMQGHTLFYIQPEHRPRSYDQLVVFEI